MNKCPPQSTGGGGLASTSMVSSMSESNSVVVGIVAGGIYVGLGDGVDSYMGCSVTVVDSMLLWSTSITITSVPVNMSYIKDDNQMYC